MSEKEGRRWNRQLVSRLGAVFRDCTPPNIPVFRLMFISDTTIMNASSSSAHNESRPYRSHKHPACNVCRHRRIRCHVDVAGEPCRFCRDRRLQCEVSKEKSSLQPSRPRRTTVKSLNHENGPVSMQRSSGDAFLSPQESSTMMADPAMAEDIRVLEKYLTSNLGTRDLASKAYLTIPHTSGESVVYLKLPRRRPRLQNASQVPGKAQREIMQRVLYFCEQEVIDLYVS